MFLKASTGESSLYGGAMVIDFRCRAEAASFQNLLTPGSTRWRVEFWVWPEGVAGEPASFCLLCSEVGEYNLQGHEKPEGPLGQGWSPLSLDLYRAAAFRRTEASCPWGALCGVSGLRGHFLAQQWPLLCVEITVGTKFPLLPPP